MGSEVASQAIIDMLVQLGIKVTVLGYVRTNDTYTLDEQEICVSRRHIESKNAGMYPIVWFAWGLLRRLPYSVVKYVSRGYVVKVRELLAQNSYDFIVLDHVQMSWMIEAVPLQGKLIGLAHNVEHQMYQSFTGAHTSRIRRLIYRRESRLIHEFESRFVKRVDQLWVLTKRDAESFATMKSNGSVRVVPLPAGVMQEYFETPLKMYDIGLIGSWTWKANEEGLRWFFDQIYPQLPLQVSIHVAGSGAQWLVGRYQNVTYDGFVDNAIDFLRQAKVVAIPTLSGGGIQIKTLDAIAAGSRIVATTLAVRGIDDFPATVRVADEPAQFVAELNFALAMKEDAVVTSDAVRWSLSRTRRFSEEIDHGVGILILGNRSTVT